MATTFFAEMEAELTALEAELERIPIFRNYKLLKTKYDELLAGWDAGDFQAHPNVSENAVPSKTAATSRPKREGTKAALIKAKAAEWFASTGRRAQSSLMCEEMRRQGIEITGSKPSAALAAVLSNDDRFDNARDERGVGYGLRSWSAIQPINATTRSASAPSDESEADEFSKSVQDAA